MLLPLEVERILARLDHEGEAMTKDIPRKMFSVVKEYEGSVVFKNDYFTPAIVDNFVSGYLMRLGQEPEEILAAVPPVGSLGYDTVCGAFWQRRSDQDRALKNVLPRDRPRVNEEITEWTGLSKFFFPKSEFHKEPRPSLVDPEETGVAFAEVVRNAEARKRDSASPDKERSATADKESSASAYKERPASGDKDRSGFRKSEADDTTKEQPSLDWAVPRCPPPAKPRYKRRMIRNPYHSGVILNQSVSSIEN